MKPKNRLGAVRPRFDRWQREANRFRKRGEVDKARWLEALIVDVRRR